MIQLTESAQSSAYPVRPHSEQDVQVYILTYIYLFLHIGYVHKQRHLIRIHMHEFAAKFVHY